MDNSDSKLNEIISLLLQLRKLFEEEILHPKIIEGWIRESEAQRLLGLKNTAMWTLRKQKLIKYSKIGGKTFYSVESIKALLKKNQK